jgi:hypothetical protein
MQHALWRDREFVFYEWTWALSSVHIAHVAFFLQDLSYLHLYFILIQKGVRNQSLFWNSFIYFSSPIQIFIGRIDLIDSIRVDIRVDIHTNLEVQADSSRNENHLRKYQESLFVSIFFFFKSVKRFCKWITRKKRRIINSSHYSFAV